jgi:DNA polymerase elongation subunit (family B)
MKTKILIYDIEISPLMGASWRRYDTNMLWIDQEQHILTVAWKWYGQKSVHALSLPDFKTFKKDIHNDKELVGEFQKVLDKADIILGQNSDRFDNKHINARLLIHGFAPMPKYKTIDTLKMSREFNFSSHKLDDLGEFFGVGKKIKTDIDLWRDCMNGDLKAFKKMVKYNKMDVILTEKVYDKMKDWSTKIPNFALMEDNPDGCPRCGHLKLEKRGFTYTQVSKFQRYRCNKCGGWSQSRIADKINKPKLK